MVWRKRGRTVRKTTARRIRRRVARVPRPISSLRGWKNARTLTVKRRCLVATALTPGTAATSNFYNYVTPSLNSAGSMFGTAMQGLTNLSEYQALFDSFRINAIKLELIPSAVDYNFSQMNPSTGTTFYNRPQFSYIIDPRGVTVPSGLYTSANYNAFQEIGPVKCQRGDRPITIYWKPLITEQFGGGATRYVKPKFADLDTNGSNMPHRGVYVFAHQQGFANTNFATYDVYATYYVTFKGMR